MSNEKELVISYLKSHGYYRVTEKKEYLEADGKTHKMIVYILLPTESQYNKNIFLELANSIDREPWLAKVDSNDYISWERVK